MLLPTFQKVFTFGVWFSALGMPIGLSTGITSWLGSAPAALAQIDTADHVCYLHGADGRQYDLSALCGGFDTPAVPANPENAVGAGFVVVPGTDDEVIDAANTDQVGSRPPLEDILQTIDNAARLLAIPSSADL